MFVKGVVLGYKGGKKNQYPHTSLIKLQDVSDKKDVEYYLGKKLVYIYKVKTADKEGSKYRTIWGKVCRAHGNSGVVRAKFSKNLPPKAFGKSMRCLMYPSRV